MFRRSPSCQLHVQDKYEPYSLWKLIAPSSVSPLSIMILLFLLCGLPHPLHALPSAILNIAVNNTFGPSSNTSVPDSDQSDNTHGTRAVEEIIYSCITVIFACTWVAVHGDIPQVTEAEGTFRENTIGDGFQVHPAVVKLHSVGRMIMAILAPEVIVLWALAQWWEARALKERFASE
jgi:hypothetical protein